MFKKKIKGLGTIFFDQNLPNINVVLDRYKVFKEKEEDTWLWFKFIESYYNTNLILDIGCNVGVYSLLATKLFKKSNVLSFDASLENCLVTQKLWEINLKKKIINGNLIVQQGMLGTKKNSVESIDSFSIKAGETIGTNKDRMNMSKTNYSILKFPLKSIGKFQDLYKEKLKDVAIKIDVDGGELDLIKGISKWQWNKIKSIAIEVDLFEFKNLKEIIIYLNKLGFKSSKSNLEFLKFYYFKLFKNDYKYQKKINSIIDLFKKINFSRNADNIFLKCKNMNFLKKRINRKLKYQINDLVLTKKRFALNLFFYK